MYTKIIGKNVKIVHKDGSRITVTEGRIIDYDSEIQTIQILNKRNNKDVFINANNINKLEVQNE